MSSNPVTEFPKGVGPETFLRACAQFATGVGVVSVLDASGAPHGMTVNSFTSVSLDPPLVLVCIDHKARIQEHVIAGKYLAINILRENQEALSSHFARPADDRFGTVEWYPGETGMPLLTGVLATMECAVTERIPAGDHTIVVGQVLAAVRHEGRPLVYFSSSYRNLDSEQL